ncbi:hypothetical protein JZ751_004048 [Albula glossodonta]|uniref:Uncharacterized protein n=1 Tax=Albula glossodonta TaxID=121402 RepID=A0A8T2PEW2_9TELE|nr:hypothetical protein JZ751_004048 [Albula glossodonta]
MGGGSGRQREREMEEGGRKREEGGRLFCDSSYTAYVCQACSGLSLQLCMCSTDQEMREQISYITAQTVSGEPCLIMSSCITTYKKTPPPVPPRTTTKPFISITAQSSTESAQDAYMDGQGPRSDMTSQSGLSNSTESIDSMKALTAAIEAANAQVHGPASQHVSNSTITITATTSAIAQIAEENKRDALRKCLSIGIQVDGPEDTLALEDQSKFQSVGIQVEEERWERGERDRVTERNGQAKRVKGGEREREREQRTFERASGCRLVPWLTSVQCSEELAPARSLDKLGGWGGDSVTAVKGDHLGPCTNRQHLSAARININTAVSRQRRFHPAGPCDAMAGSALSCSSSRSLAPTHKQGGWGAGGPAGPLSASQAVLVCLCWLMCAREGSWRRWLAGDSQTVREELSHGAADSKSEHNSTPGTEQSASTLNRPGRWRGGVGLTPLSTLQPPSPLLHHRGNGTVL